MKVFFSKRHEEALFDKKLKVSFPISCRVSIHRILAEYSNWGGFDNEENLTFDNAEEDLKTFYGVTELRAFDDNNKYVSASLSHVALGGLPKHVLDVIEAWFYQNPEKARECEKELNDILSIHNSPWRIVNGEAMFVESDYLHQEVRSKTISLLREGKAYGALEEFQEAINDLVSGERKDAVVKAHKSVESTMKTVIGTSEHLTFGQLLERLIGSGIIPEYYKEFFKHFERLALGVVKERNLPGRGHGQGRSVTEIPSSLAEFAVNLAGAINVFIIRHGIEVQKASNDQEDLLSPDDIPFSI